MSEFTFPHADELPDVDGLPDPFLRADGTRVQTQDEWQAHRSYVKAMLQHYVYGTMPPNPDNVRYEETRQQDVLDGAATCIWFTLHFERNDKQASLRCNVVIPKGEGSFPLIIKNTFNLYYLDADPIPEEFQGTNHVRIADDEAIAPDAINRGYALCKFIRTDLAADEMGSRDHGIYPLYPEYDWGAIGVWAWAFQPIIDVLIQRPEIDSDKIVATGHSRGGKTTLCAGIYDERIALSVPNSSGMGGTASLKYFEDDVGKPQTIGSHQGVRDHWWGPRFYQFADKENKSPFDAHMMKALIAPRFLMNPHALQDYHANPYGTELTHRVSKDIFKWLGCEDHIGIHWRPGGHAQNEIDWAALLDFADWHFKNKKVDRSFDTLAYPDAEPICNWDMPVFDQS